MLLQKYIELTGFLARCRLPLLIVNRIVWLIVGNSSLYPSGHKGYPGTLSAHDMLNYTRNHGIMANRSIMIMDLQLMGACAPQGSTGCRGLSGSTWYLQFSHLI